jgi:hypothetical protein
LTGQLLPRCVSQYRRAVLRYASTGGVVLALSLGVAAPAGAATADEWRTEADSICRDGNTAVNASLSAAFPNGLPQPPSAADLQLLSATVAPLFQAQHDLIADIERPAKLKRKIKKLLKTFQEGVDTIARGAESGDVTTEELDNALVPAAKQAKKLGLEVCGA